MLERKPKISFTVRQWEDVAYEMDLDRIGRYADWPMLEKGAKKLGIEAHCFQRWLLVWVAYGKKTSEMPIIKKGTDNDRQGNSGESHTVRTLPTLKRDR